MQISRKLRDALRKLNTVAGKLSEDFGQLTALQAAGAGPVVTTETNGSAHTGTGAQQTIAHNMGVVPDDAAPLVTRLPQGVYAPGAEAYQFTVNSRTADEIVVTMTSGVRFKCLLTRTTAITDLELSSS